MPKFMVTISAKTPADADGDQTGYRKEVNLLAQLTATQQTALAVLVTRLQGYVTTRYGADGVIESLKYEA